jgi:hypothetical protein
MVAARLGQATRELVMPTREASMSHTVLGVRYHHSGDTKTCAGCGGQIQRRANTSTRDWADQRYCGVACVNRSRTGIRRQPNEPAPPRIQEQPPQTWMRFAPCRGQPHNFVPDTRSTASPAIQFCVDSRCLFAAACLAYGQATKAHGVWGARYLEFGKIITSSRHGAGR